MIRHRWLLTVAIAAALVGMHHLVTEHRGHAGHFAPAPITRATGVGWSLMSSTLTADSPGGPPAVKPVQARLASTAVLVLHPCCGVSMAMVGHCCLAVSTTAPARTAASMFVTAWPRPWRPGHLRAGVGAVAVRAAPTGSVRCSQLPSSEALTVAVRSATVS
jgi:hypothetical protein